MLEPELTPHFKRDINKLKKKHTDLQPLKEVVKLVLANTKESKRELKRHHKAHKLKGKWAKSNECHVANVGDWLLIWAVRDNLAVFQRTGSHDDVFD